MTDIEGGSNMSTAPSRRKLFEAGGGLLAGVALVAAAPQAIAAASEKSETVLRTWYRLWVDQKTDWAPFSALLADDFTFTSPLDDHISKTAFKRRCWDTQINLTKGFDLELMMSKGDEVFVKYLGHTTGGNTFRNAELHEVRDGRIVATQCFFGGNMSFPSGVDSKKS